MTRRERRFVMGGAVAVLLLLLGSVVPRWRPGSAEAEGAALQVARVERMRGLAESADTLAAVARAAARAERAAASRFLEGGTPAVAAAQLSSVVREIAERSQLEILREGVISPEPAGAGTAVSLQLVARSDLPGLTDFLAGVRRSPLLLSVPQIGLGADPRERPGVPSLTITLQVTGYTLAPAGEAGTE